MIEDGLPVFLKAQVGDVSSRVYPMHAPQNVTAPYIVYEVQSSEFVDSAAGPSGLTLATFIVRIFSVSFLEAASITDTARIALNGYVGTMGTHTVQSVRITGRRPVYEPSKTGEQKGMYSVELLGVIEYDEGT